MTAPASVHHDCLEAIAAKVQVLSLEELTAVGIQEVLTDQGTIGTFKIIGDDGKLAGSFVSVSPWGVESIEDFTNSRERTIYRCLVAILAPKTSPVLKRKLEWREKIRLALKNLRIDVATVRKTSLELNPVVDARAWAAKATFLSTMVVLCESYEERGT